MKKSLCLIGFAVLSVPVNAQQTIPFKIKFLPNHTYNATMKMTMDMQVTGMPSPKVKSKTAKPQSMNSKMDMTTKFDITTGAAIPTNYFPVTMRYKDMTMKTTMNNKAIPVVKNPMVGQVIYGRSDLDGKFQVDSVSGNANTDQARETMKAMVNKIQGEVQFPERPINIGESFTQEVPMNIPAAGMNMNMKAKMTYKLTGIRANLAYFNTDITMVFDMNTANNGGIKMTGSGGGKGTLIYNIGENYASSMKNNLNINYSMTMREKVKMDAKMKMVTDIENMIGRN